MSKRIIALLLAAVMLLFCFTACAKKKSEEDPGAYITMYLTDDIYDFDPANAYYNADAVNVVSLMFETLFKLEADGSVKKSLAKDYRFAEDQRTKEKYMEIVLKETYWSNGTQLSADDVAFAWRRLLTSSNNFEAASLLFDIKNARAVKEGDESIDNVGIEAVGIDTLKITFEGEIDYDQFILNLTSVATAPLLENYVTKNADWAKKNSTMVTSGPYKLGKIIYSDILNENGTTITIMDEYAKNENGEVKPGPSTLKEVSYFYLERNTYYMRDTQRDAIDKSVANYRILVDCTKTPEQLLEDYKNGKLFYMGSIPLSLRNDALVAEQAQVSNALSTFVCYLNEYAVIDDGADGTMLFANKVVRQALSMAIDREAIAKSVVYATAASGLVCPGIFEGGKISKADFRTTGGNLLTTTANLDGAKALLTGAGIDASKYSFGIKVPAYDAENITIVTQIAEAWKALGFNVTVEEITPITNNDYFKEVDDSPNDICDDRFIEALQHNNYEVIAFDYNAFSVDAYSMLSNYATAFSGMSLNIATYKDEETGFDTTNYLLNNNSTGYMCMEYNNLMEAVYYIPYFARIDSTTSATLAKIKTKQPYIEMATMLAQSARALANDAKRSASAGLSAAAANEKSLNFEKTLPALQKAVLDLTRSFEISNQSHTRKDDINFAISNVIAALKVTDNDQLTASELNAAYAAAAEKVYMAANAIIASAQDAMDGAKFADARTLYDIVKAIYAENGITPSENKDDWTKQKAVLLHKAEFILMQDLPVIPVLFNQNAVIVSDQITNVTNTYYVPADFRKTELKDYETYTYTYVKEGQEEDETETEIISIFSEFPKIDWDKIGK
ncbi:MAG: hypothetical protein IKJ35_00620 [Clostridia bacterium]|nr:hypothetical protein [Clostridia bacterium]